MKLAIRYQLWLILIVFIGPFIAIGAVSLYNTKSMQAQIKQVTEHNLPAVRNITLADMMHDGIRAVVLEAMLSSERNEKDKLEELSKEVHEKGNDFISYVEELEKISFSQETSTLLKKTELEVRAYAEIAVKLVHSYDSLSEEKKQEVFGYFESKFKLLEVEMEKLGDAVEKEAQLANADSDAIMMINAGLTIAGVIISLVFFLIIYRNAMNLFSDIIGKISLSGDQVAQVSSELSEASHSLASGATQSAASLEETVASMEELSSMVKLSTDNAGQASEISNRNKDVAGVGSQEVSQLISSMQDIYQASSRMQEIINVIDDIAFQTNLLALNAAVEAARAGEQGKGFAVVAEAVRSLAQRSAAAAKDISIMINDSNSKIKSGVDIAEHSGQILKEIVSTAEKVSSLNIEISSSSQEQSSSISQVSQSLGTLDSASQKNAAVAEEVSASSQEILNQAQALKKVVSEMRQAIYGQGSIGQS